ncbi:MAG: hypothetical protein K9K64_01725 [Desulfohalobiaceae bacterium]|nr:hypothetical protein [Desulfohalobiaceae bacterium]
MPGPRPANHSLCLYYLEQLKSSFPSIERILHQYAHHSIADYLNTFPEAVHETLQTRQDLYQVLSCMSAPLLGKQVAGNLVADLDKDPTILTVNHHGVDYFSLTFQAGLLFALRKSMSPGRLKTAPIFSCSSISMDNLSFPRGLLLYQSGSITDNWRPQKIPIFPARLKSQLTGLCRPITGDALALTRKNLEHIALQADSASIHSSVLGILDESYSNPENLSLQSYSEQATYLNYTLGQRITKDLTNFPAPVYLDLEAISTGLLTIDLADSRSLAWKCLFDPGLRDTILKYLDGSAACWELGQLKQAAAGCEGPPGDLKCAGTVFFWGVDEKNRRISLYLSRDSCSRLHLIGRDMSGRQWFYPFTEADIMTALEKQELIPSLFLCFLVLAFARGMICVGGIHQSSYLQDMQQRLVGCFNDTPGYKQAASIVSQVPTHTYLDNMIAVASLIDNRYLVPAGPVEILAGNGLCNDDLRKISGVSVQEAHLAALFETVNDLDKSVQPASQKRKELIADYSNLLQSRLALARCGNSQPFTN